MKKIIIPAFALMIFTSCANANNGNVSNDNANNESKETSVNCNEKQDCPNEKVEPTAEQVKAIWASYMDNTTTLPTHWATLDIDKDGKNEYIHWKKDEPIMTICTFDAKNGLTLVAANNFEPKELVIVEGAGVRESIGTMTFQQETMSVIKDSKLEGIYYWTADIDEEPTKFLKADAIRTLGKQVSKDEFNQATKQFNGDVKEINFDDLDWKDFK